MKLLTGGSGRLGTELLKKGEYLAPSSKEFDITDSKKVVSYLAKYKPDLIVQSAGYVKSLEPETDALEAVRCYELNVKAARTLVKYAKCPIVYISTEGVVAPYNMYTLTKLMAENIIKTHFSYLIIRTNFWPRPFPFPKAADDLYTIGDYIDVIANLINDEVNHGCDNSTVYVGTGVKTVYDLAKQTVPNIEGVPCKTFGIPPREELLDVSCSNPLA